MKPSTTISAPSRRWMPAAAIALVSALALLLWLAGSGPSTTRPAVAQAATPSVSSPAPLPAQRPPAPASADDLPQIAADQARHAKQVYEEYAEFPPWSRPFDAAWKPFVAWNSPRTATDENFAKDRGGNLVRASMTLDRLYARPGEAITATVTLTRAGGGGAIEFDAIGMIQFWDATQHTDDVPTNKPFPGYEGVAKIDFEPVAGVANQVRAVFVPSDVRALQVAERNARFVAMVHVPGAKDKGDTIKPMAMEFEYAVEEPIAIIDKVGEHIDEHGALRVDFEVDVRRIGPIKVESVLQDASGETSLVVFNDFWRPTVTGRQVLGVTFFGHAIRRAGIDGPYSLTLHGYAVILDQDPPRMLWRDDRTFATGSYLASAFSDEPWSDPQKRDQLELYDRLADDLATGKL